MKERFFRPVTLAIGFLAITLVTACGNLPNSELPDASEYNSDSKTDRDSSILGGDGLTIGGQRRRTLDQGSGGGGLGVNAFLWRASLDTLSFMPLNSADPFGGVIITDWYAPPETPNERFKMNIYILGRQLRADGIKITVFRQLQGPGGWTDAPVEARTATDLENQVLTRARQLRVQSAGT